MAHSANSLIDQCIYLLIHSTGKLSKSPNIILVYGEHVNDSHCFRLNKQDDGYYNIIDDKNNTIIGGMKQDDGRITGKINLSDYSSYNTCIITQISADNTRMLLQPIKPKSKYDPKKPNFITREEFTDDT